MKNGFIILVIFIGFIGLIILGNYLVSMNVVPSLSEYLANFTPPNIATSSDQINYSVASSTESISNVNFKEVKAPKGIIRSEVVDTDELLAKGLGGRDSLQQDQGMLFVFKSLGKYSFWMKDMNFAIDIVWIDSNKKVIDIESNVSPDTYPKLFTSKQSVLYVLEINAGIGEKLGITEGVRLVF